MEFRKTSSQDIEYVMKIINKSQDYFKEQGIDQWQNNYPNSEVIQEDIDKDSSYVLLNNNQIVGTTALSFDGESTYDNIYEGEWLTTSDFAVIHRIAVDNSFKGLGFASKIISEVENICLLNNIKSIKVDTHEDNKSMQRLLDKCGFKYCGVIYLPDNAKRVAYEKEL
ncbi:MAG: GNAT family N-acetyltransferase [Peptostreptococcaceae bacterium]